MSKSPTIRAVVLSERVYRRLLAIYPAEHRREYGEAMAQHFRDLCRDAWATAGIWGLVVLWLRTAMDLAKTSLIEHLNNIQQRKSMLQKTLTAIRSFSTPRTTFLTLFGTVFTIVLCIAAIVAFSTPEQFRSTVRLRIEMERASGGPDAAAQETPTSYDRYFLKNQFGLILSDRTLGHIVLKLRLAENGRVNSGVADDQSEVIKNLRERIELRPINASLIEVRVYSTKSNEAAQIANALAETYREFSTNAKVLEEPVATPKTVEIVDTAIPGLRPVYPNKPLTMFLGIFGGAILAGVVACAGALAIVIFRRRPPRAGTAAA